ncbi:MAG: glyoxalase/bleomycin resistance/dioxygenase family protein [Actinobacteria bacterium]|nr:glyoxalase/bleomycin resistance/dioxygenase family protein [Actinomycetota bacterium]
MALHWKLVIDCQDAHALADFWAAALEYEVEDPGALVTQLLDAGQLPEAATVEHGGSRRFRGLAAIRHPEDPFDDFSGTGRGRRILFQEVPEKKQGKNRLHIDVHHGLGGDIDVLADRLAGLGAHRVERIDQGPAGRWWVMRDPEGNEFCAAGG